jgi:hypothetical protein
MQSGGQAFLTLARRLRLFVPVMVDRRPCVQIPQHAEGDHPGDNSKHEKEQHS